MDAIGDTVDDGSGPAAPEWCPFQILGDVLDSFAAVTRAWGNGLVDPPLPSVPSVILSGKPGTEAVGAFALDNLRSRPIRATVVATTFVDGGGELVPVQLRLNPERISLQPGESVVIRVIATVPADLAPSERLHGGIMVPGLTTSMVEMQLRSA